MSDFNHAVLQVANQEMIQLMANINNYEEQIVTNLSDEDLQSYQKCIVEFLHFAGLFKSVAIDADDCCQFDMDALNHDIIHQVVMMGHINKLRFFRKNSNFN